MRTSRTQRTLGTMTVAAALLALAAGCRAPGASFGTDPLQLRFGEATQSAIEHAESRRRHDLPEERYGMGHPITVAGLDD